MAIILLASLLACVGFSAEVSLPPEIHPCARSHPAVEECLLTETRRLKNWFVAGLPEYGVPSLDPLYLDSFTVAEVGLQTSHTNGQLTGLRDCEVVSQKFQDSPVFHGAERFLIVDKGLTTELVLKGTFLYTSHYSLNGQLLLIPVRGEGKSVVKLINSTLRTRSNFDIETAADGLRYIKLGSSKTKGKFGDVKIHMDGLFDDDKILSSTINQLLNDNWRELMNTFGPPSLHVVNQQINKYMQIFLNYFPYDLLFPDK